MLIEGGNTRSPIHVHQTTGRKWVGRITTPDGVVTLGPYPFDELIAVMNDWLRVEIGKVKRELHDLHREYCDPRP